MAASSIDVRELCRTGSALEGQWPLSGLQRLADDLAGVPDGNLHWQVRGSERALPGAAGGAPERWLALQADATVPLQCQRCLQPLLQPLRVERRFRFARDEAEAAALDDEIDDDVLVLEPRLDLHALVEDELILALPLVPRHDVCPEPLAQPDGDGAATAAEHPFAALAQWRGGAGGGSGGGKDA